MKIVRRINNNVVLAEDGNGQSLVAFGLGIGFHKTPYELTDLSRIERTFYDVNPQYISLMGDYPPEIISVSANISELAAFELQCELNPNLAFTLADHLTFAIERMKKGIDISVPFAFDIAQLYPKESELGKRALKMLKEAVGITMPEREVANIAMHLINAEVEHEDLHSTIMMMKITVDIVELAEQSLGIVFDRNSFSLNRFTMHLRYLVQRMMSGRCTEHGVNALLPEMKRLYPVVYQCADKITDYLQKQWQWECNEEETVYLMIHINRIWTDSRK